ncbi:hypothetical protein D5086_017775 [Populus alba]|uniref:Uncharacterized protein n=1 Tax=Populus alba TaxID=43335 RepID=A0ACC4BNI2_POPAL
MAFKKKRTEFRPILSGTALKASQMVKQEITCITTVNLPVHWTSLEHSSKLKLATKSNHILHLTLESQENPRKSGVRNLGRTSLQVICVLTTRNPGKRQPCTGLKVGAALMTTSPSPNDPPCDTLEKKFYKKEETNGRRINPDKQQKELNTVISIVQSSPEH